MIIIVIAFLYCYYFSTLSRLLITKYIIHPDIIGIRWLLVFSSRSAAYLDCLGLWLQVRCFCCCFFCLLVIYIYVNFVCCYMPILTRYIFPFSFFLLFPAVRSINHLHALSNVEEVQDSSGHLKKRVKSVTDNRLTGFCVHALILGTLFALELLKEIPMPGFC